MLELFRFKNLTCLLISHEVDFFYKDLELYTKKVIICNNELEAYTKIQSGLVDIVFIDESLLSINVYNLCYNIKEINKKIPISIVSNYFEIDKLLNIIPLKIECYLLKPVSSTKIVETLSMMLNELEESNILYKKEFFNYFFYDSNSKKLIYKKNNVNILLTKNEIILLELFLTNINKIVTFNMINYAFKEIKSEQAIKNLVYRLRLKIIEKHLIRNLHGIGYCLD